MYCISVKHMGESNIKCDQCDLTFNNSGSKWRHIRIVHEGIKYPCNNCGKEYADKKRLKMHMLKHHGGSSVMEEANNTKTATFRRPDLAPPDINMAAAESMIPPDPAHSSFSEQQPPTEMVQPLPGGQTSSALPSHQPRDLDTTSHSVND